MVQLFVISCVLSGKCHLLDIKDKQQMCGGNNHSLQTKHSINPHINQPISLGAMKISHISNVIM